MRVSGDVTMQNHGGSVGESGQAHANGAELGAMPAQQFAAERRGDEETDADRRVRNEPNQRSLLQSC